jgi:abortive infection bacteriophage resistance protein
MAHCHGSHSHLDSSLALNLDYWQGNINKLKAEVARSNEIFICHLRDTYDDQLPPIWAVVEVMSLGLLSNWYANLKPFRTRKSISLLYQIDHEVLQSWLHHLTIVRNTCAHHSRLWNREFKVVPKRSRTKPPILETQLRTDSRKLYNTLVILLYLLDVISPNHHWRTRIKELLSENIIWLPKMDFPPNWEELAIWQEK